jgi:pimeloyl-ACP methyl ester carboxylesterase
LGDSRIPAPPSEDPGPAPPVLPSAEFVRSDGLTISFRRFGSGRPLVLVHGWGADLRTNWVDTGWIETLAPYRSLIAIDVRGHGRSSKPHFPELYSYAAMSRDVLAVMDALEIEACDFMGYSMGAFMGAWLLGHHACRFTSMVLGGIGDETEKSAAQGAVIAQILRDAAGSASSTGARQVQAFVETIPDNDPEALACSAEQMWPEGHPIQLAGTGLSKARLPVLIVNGSNDHPYVDSADAFAEALPSGTHLIIPGTDHLTTVSSQRFQEAVVGFLSNIDAADR